MVRTVIALVMFGHGIGHAVFLANTWGQWKIDASHSWLFWSTLGLGQPSEGVIGLSWVLPMTGFVAFAWGFQRDRDWSLPVVVTSAVISSVLIVLWWGGINLASAFIALVVNLAIIAFVLVQDQTEPAI
jgi:hypothetical protein